ncbi:VWA domain-containing protein [Streptomyces sp. NRRL S-146]|uniref:VWA domain-containing protein n=1 Tax=Streptomyces sp. NRRL S-146 TaxID=1463884 RepID=UPI0004CA1F5A|nr:VWA domain-containing protein [Streptomyces sp. NRRL S-146]
MAKPLSKLKDLASRAGKWLGLGGDTPPVPKATAAVVADRFDTMAWRETYDQAPRLAELAEELNEKYDHTTDLLGDVFLAAYKVTPKVRGRDEMDSSRLVNHQVVTSMVTSPEFEELHRETAGDPYAAAMAVLAQASALRRMLEQSRRAAEQAQQAGAAQAAAEEAGRAVGVTFQRAADAADDDGDVPEAEASAVQRTVDHAEDAAEEARQANEAVGQALAAVTPGIRAAARRALAEAAEAAREEAALMRAWGVEPGQLERMSFEQRATLAERLRGGRLGQFADLIGRFRQMATGERAHKVEHAPGELVGITLGDDLGRVVPSEIAQLGVPALRAVFAAKFAESRLMLYDSRGEHPTGRGAIIACVDCSYSMASPPVGAAAAEITSEAWAKACALALLDQARQAKRDFVGILFSSATQVSMHAFPASESAPIERVIDFAEHFFAGGTNFEAPLSAAAEVLEAEFNTEGRARGDIVLITDGECGVGEDWMHHWNDTRHRLGFRTFGIAIGDGPATTRGSVLDALSDNLRNLHDLTDPRAVADIFRVI